MAESVLIIPDTHYPDTDMRVFNAMLGAIKEVKPDRIIHIGDVMDYPQPSRWTKGTRYEFEGSVFEDSEKAI
ncbi:metallophosphoesterase family protein, partial [Escherichia coli]|nr:metallophosphoesterase family protein [Escherichia coli]